MRPEAPTGHRVNYIWEKVQNMKTVQNIFKMKRIVKTDSCKNIISALFADLSNYIPKHSVDFSAWQEHKRDESLYQEETASQQTQMTEEVMVSEVVFMYPKVFEVLWAQFL